MLMFLPSISALVFFRKTILLFFSALCNSFWIGGPGFSVSWFHKTAYTGMFISFSGENNVSKSSSG